MDAADESTMTGSVQILYLGGLGFDAASLQALADEVADYLASDAVGLVWTGSGKPFGVGARVEEFQNAINSGTAPEFVATATGILHPVFCKLHADSRPQVAAMNGVAAGGALGLALLCDERIGCDATRIAAGYLGVGLCPDGAATWALPQLIGVQRTRRFLLDNEVMNAETAFDAGVLDELVDGSELVAHAVARVQHLATWNPVPRASIKANLALHSLPLAEHLRHEREWMIKGAGEDEFAARVAAFLSRKAA